MNELTDYLRDVLQGHKAAIEVNERELKRLEADRALTPEARDALVAYKRGYIDSMYRVRGLLQGDLIEAELASVEGGGRERPGGGPVKRSEIAAARVEVALLRREGVRDIPLELLQLAATPMTEADNPADLEGATTPPDEARYPADGGEFAAKWNAMTTEQRDEWVARMVETSQRSYRCVTQDHTRYIAHLEDDHSASEKVLIDSVNKLADKLARVENWRARHSAHAGHASLHELSQILNS